MTPFDILLSKQIHSKSEVLESGLSVPLLLEWLSKTPNALSIATYIKQEFLQADSLIRINQTDGVYIAYLYAKIQISISKIQMNRWVKAEKNSSDLADEINPDVLSVVSNNFGMGRLTAAHYIVNTLTVDELKKLYFRKFQYGTRKFPTRNINKVKQYKLKVCGE